MTNEQINLAITETIDADPHWKCAKDYCNDLNAMHEAEQTLWRKDWNLRYSFLDELGKIMQPTVWHRMNATDMLDATARQRAEAFLRTLGKWEEAICKCGAIMGHDDGGRNYCCRCGYDTGHPCSQDNLTMNAEEEAYWIEAGLQCHGVELDQWTKDAIIRYGRFLTERFLTDIHDLRLDNSGQALLIEKLKKETQ